MENLELSEASKKVFYRQLRLEISYIKILMGKIEQYNLVNEQEVLNWLDELNKLSVKH